jgi:hypothetical protein
MTERKLQNQLVLSGGESSDDDHDFNDFNGGLSLDEHDSSSEQDDSSEDDAAMCMTITNKRKRKDPAIVAIARQNKNVGAWTQQQQSGVFVKLTHTNPMYIRVLTFTVPANRKDKAMTKLDPKAMELVLTELSSCKCSGNRCQLSFSVADVINCRKAVFGNPDMDTEQKVTEELVRLLALHNPNAASNDGANLKYYILVKGKKVPVCSRFWPALYGICESKMKKVRRMVNNGSKLVVHGSQGQRNHPKMIRKAVLCHGFWTHFFDKTCQRPTETMRLFPVNKPYDLIYIEFFLPWFKKQSQPAAFPQLQEVHFDDDRWAPSLSTLKRARMHIDFKDVKERPKHYHAKCGDCDELNTIRLRGFVDSVHKQDYEILFLAHQAEARGWHEHEEGRKAASRANPRDMMVIGYDDTSDLMLPKCTNRDIKNLTKSRLHVIPFNITNYTSGNILPIALCSMSLLCCML